MTTPDKRPAVAFAIIAAAFIGLGVAGDTLTSLMINGSGVVQNKQTLTHSNALRVVSAPSQSNDVVRWQDLAGATNSLGSLTNELAAWAGITNYVGGATNAADVMRIPLYSSASIAASSNMYVLNPFAIGARSAGSQILIPSKYRYIRKYVVVIPSLGNYGETNWANPTVMFQVPGQINVTAYQQVETEHGGANSVAGFWYSWSNFPNVWVRSLYASASSGKGIVWSITNSVELPAAWWSNANAFASGSYSFGQGTLINLNSFSMSNGAPVSGYIEFSTTP